MPDQTLSLADALELAMGLHKAGVLQAADEIYRRVLEAQPDHVDALHFLGLSRHQQGDRTEALALVERAVALAPQHWDARNNLGNLLLEGERLEEAESVYRQVLAARPEHADAQANLGTVLRRRGDLAAAEAAFRRAVALNPEHGEAYHNLGSILRDGDRPDEALAAYQRALVLCPYDGDSYLRVGATLNALGRVTEAVVIYQRWLSLEPGNAIARHMLAAASGQETPARASDAFVSKTFDAFAGSFDRVLERLEYRAPALVAEAVAAAVTASSAELDVLDAGAGTGLCGPLLRGYARRLVGIDLSPGMLTKADERGCYDALVAAELTAYMSAHPAAFDLVVSADTLVYFGDLSEALAAAAVALRPGGLLVFTVENAADPPAAGYRLNSHGRYSHGEGYLRRALTAAGLTPLVVAPAHLRIENRQPVSGLVVTARRMN